MKRVEDINFQNIDWKKYEKELAEIKESFEEIKQDKKLMRKIEKDGREMKLFKKANKEEKILSRLEDVEFILSDKIEKLALSMKEKNFERERTLEDLAFNARRKAEKEFENKIKILKGESEAKDVIINQQIDKIEKLKTKNQNLCGKAGGATKENNKLKKEIEELKAQIKELKSNRYRVKTLRSSEPKNGQKMKETIRPVGVVK